MKLEHVALNVENPAGMAKWYADNLAMRIIRADDESPFIHFIADKDGQSMLELFNNPAVEVPDYAAIDPFVLHLAFLAEDIEGERERLITAGATAVGEITPAPTGDQLAFLRDPWKVPFQLIKRLKPLL